MNWNWRAALQNFKSFKNLKAEQEELCGKQGFVQVALCSEGLRACWYLRSAHDIYHSM